MEPVTTDRYIGETLDFIQSVFDQLADSVCWYIREDDVETFKKAFENNTPPPNTFRQNIARAIKTQIDLTSD